MISFNAFAVSSIDGIVSNLNDRETAIGQACCERVVLLVVDIECADKYQMHN